MLYNMLMHICSLDYCSCVLIITKTLSGFLLICPDLVNANVSRLCVYLLHSHVFFYPTALFPDCFTAFYIHVLLAVLCRYLPLCPSFLFPFH